MPMFKCSNCDYESNRYFGLCTRCKEGVGEEIETPQALKISSNVKLTETDEVYEKNKVSKDIKHREVVKTTQFSVFNKMLSTQGGFVKDQVIAMGASPGAGKSTLCTQIAGKGTKYISTEESYSQVCSRFLRVNPDSEAIIVSCSKLNSVIKEIYEDDGSTFIIIDSLNNINNGSDGYLRQSQNMALITKALKDCGKIAIVICQVTKKGEITGFNSILHVVDSVFYFERSATNSNNIILYSNKNRFAEIGSVSFFSHTADGLVELSDEEENRDPEVGVSYSKAQFGFKSIQIKIEALVAPSSMNFGIRRSTGIKSTRVEQILGVISFIDKNVNFVNKDVYLAVTNGLTVDDPSLDFAIANAILSSYFKKNSVYKDNINGAITLNGMIPDRGMSVKDLINKYKSI